MIGLDTNVLVRYLTQDEAAQAEHANALLERVAKRRDRVFVGQVVLCELVWVLRGPYGVEKQAVVATLEQLLATEQFEVEGKDAALLALEEYRRGPADFADYLIGRQHLAAGCTVTVTFDRKLARCESFELLTG